MTALQRFWEAQQERLDRMERERAQRMPRWRTRRVRKLLSWFVLAGSVLLIIGAAQIENFPDWVFFGFWFGGCLLAGVPYYLLRILTGKMSGGFSTMLDERERAWRHRVTYIGYQILVGLMLVGIMYGIVISKEPEAGFRATLMMMALLTVGTLMPTVVLAWTLPDDDPEDFAEGADR
ncbi:hypothetical protein [Amycolatopsis sp. NPDC059657]|uniref:hypothetical protein n=1 Tax=Amycolatopsis sp. NPDC059657 TaxID=3346899 RepID=UPI003672CDF6